MLKALEANLKTLQSSKLIRNIAKVSGGDALSRLVGFGTTILIIRGLPVSDYAAYTAFYAIVIFASGFVGSGINRALVRFSTERISKTGTKPIELYFVSFLVQVILYSMLCLVVFVLMDEVNHVLFGEKDFHLSLRYGLIAGLGFLMIEAGRCIYQAEERFGMYVKTLWFRQVLILCVVGVLFLSNKLNFERSAQAVIIGQLCIGTVIAFHVLRDINFNRIKSLLREESDLLKDFAASLKWLIAYFFVLMSFQRLDIFMLSHLSSTEELAFYGIAFHYFSLVLMLRVSIHAVLLPKFSKVDMQDVEKQRQFARKWIKVTMWLIIPIIIADVFGKPIFIWINGIQYEKSFDIFRIFSIGIWISLVFSPLVNVIMARKAFRFLFLLSLIAFTVNFAGNYYFISFWGGMGAAVVTIVAHGLINIASSMRVFLSAK